MASPQTENGYVKISNELLEAFARINIPGESRRILDVIIRKTYGFNKKEDAISLSQFSKYTGIKTSHVVRAVNKLINMNIINKNTSKQITIYSIQKDYKKWKPTTTTNAGTPQMGTPQMGRETTPQMGNQVLPKWGDTKDILTKEKKEKETDFKKSEYNPRKPYPDTGIEDDFINNTKLY